MRHRGEILFDGVRKTDKGVMIPEFSDKLDLLKLEVLIDIRDQLTNLSHSLESALVYFHKQS